MNTEKINEEQVKLYQHSVIKDGVINDIIDLRNFMELHVFCVWDFMSLIKTLQHNICPSTTLWLPGTHIQDGTARLINDIVLCEESDITEIQGTYLSHFDMYIKAMEEVGADTKPVLTFLNTIVTDGLDAAMESIKYSHRPAYNFIKHTFKVIEFNHIAGVAASFTFGRETAIPDMFKGIVETLKLSKSECPMFIYYLERHIEIDGGDHGPMALKLIDRLCNNANDHEIAEVIAINSIHARIQFWTELSEVLEIRRLDNENSTNIKTDTQNSIPENYLKPSANSNIVNTWEGYIV